MNELNNKVNKKEIAYAMAYHTYQLVLHQVIFNWGPSYINKLVDKATTLDMHRVDCLYGRKVNITFDHAKNKTVYKSEPIKKD